jgi:predicted DNA-binding protein (MmcQ/YjbR family)
MSAHQPIRSPQGLATISRVREATASFPEVAERVDKFGHTTFRIRDKPFVFLGEDGSGCWMSVKADRHLQQFLLTRDEFERTPYIGQHGWTSIRVDRIPAWAEMEGLIRQAYLLVAPRRLARTLEAE